ncbi:MAG: aminoacyl-tRNA hydrolase [Spirochaetaceae bacterium]|jgi:PTH1 family peptidyl-tRNA hydrolase|nr:aminoacyl-tRNA hydrolase [Spirochaetaceae bacterium]
MLVFLGNPGSEYAGNRHNTGRFLADNFSFSLYWRNNFKGLFSTLPVESISASHKDGFVAETEQHYLSVPPGATKGKTPVEANTLYFLKPETYMNLSGRSVQAAAIFYKIPAKNILVVHDELELPLGQAALKFSGGLGGHNGLRSIKESLGTADFWRLRIGIGRPAGEKANTDISDWVLSDFSPEETPVLSRVLSDCASAVERAISLGPQALLPEWNKKKIV